MISSIYDEYNLKAKVNDLNTIIPWMMEVNQCVTGQRFGIIKSNIGLVER